MHVSHESKFLTVSLFLLLLLGCQQDSHTSGKQSEVPLSIEEQGESRLVLPIPKTQPPRFTPQRPLIHLPKSIQVSLLSTPEETDLIFNLKKNSPEFDNPLYTFESAYKPLNTKRLTHSASQRYSLRSPWKVIWADLRNFYVYGGPSLGQGRPIGYIHHDKGVFVLESVAPIEIMSQSKVAQFSESEEVITIEIQNCPSYAEDMGKISCTAYVGLYNTFAKIDYSVFGAIAPQVAHNIMSSSSVLRLIDSYLKFTKDMDSVRDEYMIPLLKAIQGVDKLSQIDPLNEQIYLRASAQAYSDLLSVSLETTLKTQILMPQAFETMNHLALGSALAYLGTEKVLSPSGDNIYPNKYKEIIAPIVREFGLLTFDLILNGTNTPTQVRVEKLLMAQDQLKKAVEKLCAQNTSGSSRCHEVQL